MGECSIMRKIIISLLLLVPFVSGCSSIDTRLTINADKSASVVSSLAYKGNLANLDDNVAETIDANYTKFLDPLYLVQNMYSKKLSTITATKSVANIEKTDIDLSSLGFKSNLPNGKFVGVRKNLIVTAYNVDATYDLQAQKAKIEEANELTNSHFSKGLEPEYIQKYADLEEFSSDIVGTREDFMENLDDDTKSFIENNVSEVASEEKTQQNNEFSSSFSIKLPTFASYNNADSVSDNIYTWNIKNDEPTEIKLQYIQYHGFSIFMILLLGVLLIGLLARRIYKRESQKQLDAE